MKSVGFSISVKITKGFVGEVCIFLKNISCEIVNLCEFAFSFFLGICVSHIQFNRRYVLNITQV